MSVNPIFRGTGSLILLEFMALRSAFTCSVRVQSCNGASPTHKRARNACAGEMLLRPWSAGDNSIEAMRSVNIFAVRFTRLTESRNEQQTHLRKWGRHLSHSASTLCTSHRAPVNTVRLETDAGKTGHKWAKATSIKDIDLTQVHPTFFKFHNGSWVPFEFAQGPLPIAMEAIPVDFLPEFAAYLMENQLTDKIALELGHFANCRSQTDSATAEIEVQWGEHGEPFTLVVSAKDVVGVDGKQRRLVPTGWHLTIPCSGPQNTDTEQPAGTYYLEQTKSDGSKTHKVFVGGGNSSSKNVTAELVVGELVKMGIIHGCASRDLSMPHLASVF